MFIPFKIDLPTGSVQILLPSHLDSTQFNPIVIAPGSKSLPCECGKDIQSEGHYIRMIEDGIKAVYVRCDGCGNIVPVQTV